MRAPWALAALAALAATGCFDSLVGADCADGYVAEGGACRLALDPGDDGPDSGPGGGGDDDGGVGVGTDGGGGGGCGAPELVCAGDCVDPRTDPDNCGGCGIVCASGLCEAGTCAGVVAGHVVAIGHDYRSYRTAAARVLGNAVALGVGWPVRVTLWEGDAEPEASDGVLAALTEGMALTGRAWTIVPAGDSPPEDRGETDVVIILSQRGSAAASAALGDSWRARLGGFVATGGVVVALAGPGATTADLVRAADLLDVTADLPGTGQALTIVAMTDAVAVGVPSPYLGAAGTTTFGLAAAAAGTVVVRNPDGRPVVVHRTR